MIWPKKSPGHVKFWPRINPFFLKNQNFDPKYKIPKNQWEKLKRFHYCQILKFWFFKSALLLSIDSGLMFYMSGKFLGPNHFKKPVCMFMRNYKEILPWEVANFFSFLDLMDLTIWDF